MRYRRQYTLLKRHDGSGKAIWYFRIYVNDKRVTKTTGCTSKERAMMYVENILADSGKLQKLFDGNIVAPAFPGNNQSPQHRKGFGILFSEYAKDWWLWDTCTYVLNKRASGTPKKPGIKRSYVDKARMWTTRYLIPYFGSFELSQISIEMINQFLSILEKKYELSPKTINNIRSILSVMMREAKYKRLIEENPVPGSVCRKTEEKKTILLSDEECSMLFDPNRIQELWQNKICYYTVNYISGLTGMRVGELLALTIKDISPTEIRVQKNYSSQYGVDTTKNSEERTIPITKEMYQLLCATYYAHEHDSDFIFTLTNNRPMGTANTREALYRAMAKIGISEEERKRRNITFHSWRHKFATDCVKEDMHPLKIKALTGHKTLDMLYRYTDLNTQDLAPQVNDIQKKRGAALYKSAN